MFEFLFSSDQKQSLRMLRHFASMLALLLFTLCSLFFLYCDLYSVESSTFYAVLVFFWSGVFIFTVLISSGINKKYSDPSLTMAQLIWGTFFMLTIAYLLNEWRGLMLMTFLGMLSFGFFKLRFREFLSVVLLAILGYALILLHLFIYEPARIEVNFELMQLLMFSCSLGVMLYTCSAINHLRDRTKNQYIALQEALEINKKLATTDDLTGLFNRRYFMEKLAQQKALSERNDSDFVICYCDLDHFKHINDSFGHHTGDIVLQKFSEILKASIREIDYAARFGGEEFVCLLVNTDIENALKVTERIRETLANYNFSDIAPSLHATVSIGIANFKQFNTLQETLMCADNRMYLAKNLGRNKVVYSDDKVADQALEN
ncbi:MAG: GGDEF domain-containing protein [Gammaproteobacteria bacterium]|nr:GGDEF domain-containing protein [Gammaproteobacteria bacterium]